MAEKRRRRGKWWFLALVALAYGATGVLDPGLASRALAAFGDMLRQVAPVLLLVFALLFLVERFLTAERTRDWLGRHSGPRAWLLAVLAGVLSSGPVYAWYGLLGELRDRGMRPALVAVVLYARAIKLPLLPLLAHYFGLRYAVLLSLAIALFALINGLVMERLLRS